MKNYILIFLMVITLVVVGCDNKEPNNEEGRKDETQVNGESGNFDNSNSDDPETSGNTDNSNNEDPKTSGNNDDEVVENNQHQVSFYLFYMSTCSYCHEEREWIASIEDEYDYVDFKLYEVSENKELYQKVREAYNIESTSVPLTIIGNDYFIGYTSSKNRKFIRYIEDLSTFDNCDVVATIEKGGNIEKCMRQNEK